MRRFGYRKLSVNQLLRISEEIDANVGLQSLQPAILLIENKWFVGFKGLTCGVGMWHAQGTASRWVCSLKYALISWLLVEVEKSAVDCSLKALGFSC